MLYHAKITDFLTCSLAWGDSALQWVEWAMWSSLQNLVLTLWFFDLDLRGFKSELCRQLMMRDSNAQKAKRKI